MAGIIVSSAPQHSSARQEKVPLVRTIPVAYAIVDHDDRRRLEAEIWKTERAQKKTIETQQAFLKALQADEQKIKISKEKFQRSAEQENAQSETYLQSLKKGLTDLFEKERNLKTFSDALVAAFSGSFFRKFGDNVTTDNLIAARKNGTLEDMASRLEPKKQSALMKAFNRKTVFVDRVSGHKLSVSPKKIDHIKSAPFSHEEAMQMAWFAAQNKEMLENGITLTGSPKERALLQMAIGIVNKDAVHKVRITGGLEGITPEIKEYVRLSVAASAGSVITPAFAQKIAAKEGTPRRTQQQQQPSREAEASDLELKTEAGKMIDSFSNSGLLKDGVDKNGLEHSLRDMTSLLNAMKDLPEQSSPAWESEARDLKDLTSRALREFAGFVHTEDKKLYHFVMQNKEEAFSKMFLELARENQKLFDSLEENKPVQAVSAATTPVTDLEKITVSLLDSGTLRDGIQTGKVATDQTLHVIEIVDEMQNLLEEIKALPAASHPHWFGQARELHENGSSVLSAFEDIVDNSEHITAKGCEGFHGSAQTHDRGFDLFVEENPEAPFPQMYKSFMAEFQKLDENIAAHNAKREAHLKALDEKRKRNVLPANAAPEENSPEQPNVNVITRKFGDQATPQTKPPVIQEKTPENLKKAILRLRRA